MNNLFGRGADSDGETGSWSRWANYVVNEVRRAANGVDKLEMEIRDISKDVGQMQNQITQVSASFHLDVLQSQVQNLKEDLNEMKTFVEECKKFKAETKVIFGVITFTFSTGLVLLGIFLK